MRAGYKYILLLILLLITGKIQAQKDVISLFSNQLKLAQKYYNEFSYRDAALTYTKVYKKSGEDSICLKIALCYDKLNDPEESIYWFKAIRNKEIYLSGSILNVYEKNLAQVQNYINVSGAQHLSDTLSSLTLANSASKDFYKDSSYYTINNLNINTSDDEFGARVFNEGLLFVSSRKPSLPVKDKYNWNDRYFINFFKGDFREDGSLLPVVEVQVGMAKNLNKGPFALLDSGKKIIFTGNFASEIETEQINKLGLYYATIGEKGIRNLIPININSPTYSVGHPVVNSSGNILYFISDMPGGFGGTDIYSCKFEKGICTDIKNLGSAINTPQNEMFPFVFQDSVLFFSSSGHMGAGGLDIFFVSLKNETAKPVNLKYPINSSRDDFGFSIEPKGNYGFFSSSRQGGKGGDDLYSFRINAHRLQLVFKDKDTGALIDNVSVGVEEESMETPVFGYTIDSKGNYYVFPGKKYRFIISKNNYKKEVIEYLYKEGDSSSSVGLDVFLKKQVL